MSDQQSWSPETMVLAALTAWPEEKINYLYLQKFLYLLDQELSDSMGGPCFDFIAYEFGPVDGAVADMMRRLAALGLVAVSLSPARSPLYALTEKGRAAGAAALAQAPAKVSSYVRLVADWAYRQGAGQLVRSINHYQHQAARRMVSASPAAEIPL